MKLISYKNYLIYTAILISTLLFFFIKFGYSRTWEQPILILVLIGWLLFSILYEIKKKKYSKSKSLSNLIVSFVFLLQIYQVNSVVSKLVLTLFFSVCLFLTFYEYIKYKQKNSYFKSILVSKILTVNEVSCVFYFFNLF